MELDGDNLRDIGLRMFAEMLLYMPRYSRAHRCFLLHLATASSSSADDRDRKSSANRFDHWRSATIPSSPLASTELLA
jgi:hypothetical protein